MFLRLMILFALIWISALAASWLMVQPGALSIEWLGWHMKMRSSLAITIVIIFAFSLVLFDRLQRGIWSMPRWLGGRWRQRQEDAGNKALTLGLMAVSAGELAEARRQAARAQRLLKSPQLTSLLSAQVAHLAGDHAAARHYFNDLTLDQDSAFLGHIGLMRLALDAKDPSTALHAASKALALRPKSALAATQLLKLHADNNDWPSAISLLDLVIKNCKKKTGNVSAMLMRQRTAFLYLDGLDKCLKAGDNNSAMSRFKGVLQHNPVFLPAILDLADLYVAQSKPHKATRLLEKSFALVPHTNIAERLQRMWGNNDGKTVSKLITLMPKTPAALEHAAYNVVSDIAATVGLDGEAKRLRNLYDESIPVFGWQCARCKSRHDSWHSHCQSCGTFAGLNWQQPEKITPLIGS